MSLFLSRSRLARPHLEWRIALFAVGAALGVAGMVLERGWLTWVGIGALVAGVLVRFMPGGGDGEGGEGV